MQVALRRALDAIENRVRQKHRNYKEHWKRRAIHNSRADARMDAAILLGEVYDEMIIEKCWPKGSNAVQGTIII